MKPVKEDEEIQNYECLPVLKATLSEQLKNELKSRRTQVGGLLKNERKKKFVLKKVESISTSDTYEKDADDQKLEQQFEKMIDTYSSFANNFIIFDPLDRAIPKESFDEGVKRDDLVDQIGKLNKINGKNLHVPMTNSLYQQLKDMFSDQEEQCIELSRQYVQQTCM